MDENNLLSNDSYENDDYESEIYYPDDSTDDDYQINLGPYLGSNKKYIYSTNKILKGSLTLRECNLRYRQANGIKNKDSYFAEFDRCQTKGCISPMRKFNNAIGHFAKYLPNSESSYSIICFKPELCQSLHDFKDSLQSDFDPTIRHGYLWNIQNCSISFKLKSDKWMFNNEILDDNIASAFDILSVSFNVPLSCHTQHAYFESEDNKDIIGKLKIFQQLKETTAVTGILGTLQNNQLIDLAQEEDSNQVDVEARYKDLEMPGFLCSGHTAHSMEAGRVRRVCHQVSVRVLCKDMLNKLYRILEITNKYNNESKQWILFCMGKLVYCSTKALIFIRNQLVSLSSIEINMPTLHINNEMHTAIISVSSGVLLRRDVNNLVINTISLNSSEWLDGKYSIQFPDLSTDEGFKFYFSTFFQLTPYIPFDRPPRTLISSVQSIQAVTLPYGAGTSSVAPNHTSKPLVSTPLIEELIASTVNGNECNLSDMIPGEDLVVCFANFNDTNEDSIMMSSGSASRGLFSYMAYGVHVIKNTENIPNDGEYANIYDNRWWKSYSRRSITENMQNKVTKEVNGIKVKVPHFIAGGDGRGKIISRNVTPTGEISVKSIRYSTPITGDKLATGHGQKGVIKLIPEQDMPWGLDDNNEVIRFDIIISLSSISNRITTGQYYEMVSGIEAAKEGRRLIIAPSKYNNNHSETILYDGKVGELLHRCSDKGDVPIQASWGINRIWQMTQLTWDKQHYTHNTTGKYSINTTVGRTAGGGIRFGEMESHAVEASGLIEPYRELKSRMDLINTQICTKCNMLAQMCNCENNEGWVMTSIPHSLMVFAYSNLLTSGFTTHFKVTY